jgi:hypothetical protein
VFVPWNYSLQSEGTEPTLTGRRAMDRSIGSGLTRHLRLVSTLSREEEFFSFSFSLSLRGKGVRACRALLSTQLPAYIWLRASKLQIDCGGRHPPLVACKDLAISENWPNWPFRPPPRIAPNLLPNSKLKYTAYESSESAGLRNIKVTVDIPCPLLPSRKPHSGSHARHISQNGPQ